MEATLKKKSPHYPKPGPVGGRLIRQVVSQLRGAGVELPITSYILIAVSGGSDSIALAHLLAKYGRRAGGPKRLALLHINHGWRGEDSDSDARFVEELARKLELPVYVHRLKPPGSQKGSSQGESWEDLARQARKRIYQKEAREKGAVILTAHQADDVAETMLWRLFTGAAKTHGGGIAVRHGVELRPLVAVRKSELQAYLKEEGQTWREDSTNLAGRFLRSQMRLKLMPVIEKLFPQAIPHLVRQALEAQNKVIDASAREESRLPEELSSVFEAAGLKLRRPHWQAIQAIAQQKTSARLQLEKGWELSYEPAHPSGQSVQWILRKASGVKTSN